MRRKILAFVLYFSFLHLVYSIPSLFDINKCKKRNGNFPKPGSVCRSYYSCKNWTPKEIVCPSDEHFFPAKGYCVHPDMYPCFEKPESKECPRLNGKFLKPNTGCKVYYDCCNGVPTEKRCSSDLLFNQKRGICDRSDIVTCPESVSITGSTPRHSTTRIKITSTTHKSTRTKKTIITTTIDSQSSTTTATDSDENSSEEGNSSEEKGKRSSTKSKIKSTTPKISTPYTSTFDGKIITDTAATSLSIFTEDLETPSSSSDESPEVPFMTSSLKSSPSTENRTKRIMSSTVSEGISVLTSKKIGSTNDRIENTFTSQEVTPEKSTMATEPFVNKDTDSTTKTSYITDSATFNIFCPESDGYFPHPNDRHKFIACVGGNPIIMHCPENLFYDHEKRSCEYNII